MDETRLSLCWTTLEFSRLYTYITYTFYLCEYTYPHPSPRVCFYPVNIKTLTHFINSYKKMSLFTSSFLICFALPPLLLEVVQAVVTPTALSTIPTATASPISPPPDTFADDLIQKLVTASLYSTLFANGGDYQATCDAINAGNLSGVGSSGINGTAVRSEICTGASLVAQNADLGPAFREFYRRGAGSLAIALFAVRIVGGFAGGPNLTGLCSEIEEELINVLFVGFTDTDVGSQVKNYICGAAAASSSASATCPTKIPTGGYNHTIP